MNGLNLSASKLFGIAVIGIILGAAVAWGADQPLAWPQFRGPGGNGVADDERPPIEFGPDKNVKWSVPAPGGMSSPIVMGELLVLTAFEKGKLYTIAYRRADGAEAWRAEAPAEKLEQFNQTQGNPAASTPVTDGERVVSYFGSCGLFCYDAAGKELWSYKLPPAVTLNRFGSGVSPIIAKGLVILLRDEQKNSKVIAIDATSGDLKWEKSRASIGGFSTPVLWEVADGVQVVAVGTDRMIGYDLKSGNEKWFVVGMPSVSCASPATLGGDLLFAGWSPGAAGDKEVQLPSFDQVLAGENGDVNGDGALSKAESEKNMVGMLFDNNDTNQDGFLTRDEHEQQLAFMAASINRAFALRPGGMGDVTATHMRWQKARGLPYVASAIAYGGQYLMAKEGGILTAYDPKSGDELYYKRALASGNYYASPVAARGHVYFVTLDDGAFTVLKVGASKSTVAASNPPLGERVAATPAIADDTLYVRTASRLYAFTESAK